MGDYRHMKFERWKSQDDYTHAFRLFNKHHTLMNSIYWAYVPTFNFATYNYKNKVKHKCDITTHEAFELKGGNSKRVEPDINKWNKNLKEFDNWTRLNVLVSVNSYFEIYLSSVVSLAIESDPGILYSAPKQINGIQILKYGDENQYSFFDISEKVTKGEWQQRISNYKKIFGFVPQELTKYTSELEKIRKIRNNVAHSFGRDINQSRARKTVTVIDTERISTETLQKYMGIIREVARGVDDHLLNNHIGDYEMIHFYHQVKDELSLENTIKDLKRQINSLDTKNKGWEYIKQLKEYYDTL